MKIGNLRISGGTSCRFVRSGRWGNYFFSRISFVSIDLLLLFSEHSRGGCLYEDPTETALLANRIRDLSTACDEIVDPMDIIKRRLVQEQFNNGETSVLLVTSGLDIYVKLEMQYLYLNNNSIVTLKIYIYLYSS